MARENECDFEYEIARLQEELTELRNTLQILFDLLEEYAPRWYTREHHLQAASALERATEPSICIGAS